MRNYILVGLGPHAKRIYYPLLEKHQSRFGICLKLLIDIESQSQVIEKYLDQKQLKPEKIVYIKDSQANRMGTKLDTGVEEELNNLVKNEKIDGIIISTEPKAHKIYADWALKNDVNILMDKPITAPIYPNKNLKSARQIYKDFLHLNKLLKKSKSKFYVTCQRRNHEGYVFIKEYLKDFISKFRVPISYIDIYHADGSWSLPHEFNKECHPYKYGYGKLMHSGYHFVDLFSWLVEANNVLLRAQPNKARIYTSKFTPNDLFNQVDKGSNINFLNRKEFKDFYKTYKHKDYESFGELDAYTLLQLMNKQRVITTGSINLQQNSFSRRGWFELPEDIYKGNGRVRHERVNIQVSYLLNIQVHSYQSNEPPVDGVDLGDAGDKDHFDIYIFRNTKVVGGKAFEKISIGRTMAEKHTQDSSYLGHNEKAREVTFLNFIQSRKDESELGKHNFTNKLLSNIYVSIAKGTKTGNSGLSFKC